LGAGSVLEKGIERKNTKEHEGMIIDKEEGFQAAFFFINYGFDIN